MKFAIWRAGLKIKYFYNGIFPVLLLITFWKWTKNPQEVQLHISTLNFFTLHQHFISLYTLQQLLVFIFANYILCWWRPQARKHRSNDTVLLYTTSIAAVFFFFFTSLAFFLSPCILDVVPETPTLLFLQHKQICRARIVKWWWVGCIHLKQKERKKRKEKRVQMNIFNWF